MKIKVIFQEKIKSGPTNFIKKFLIITIYLAQKRGFKLHEMA